ncbi:hypothetical protein M5D96_003935 [Drosophila gunungcola]|uniref:Uncharacterized protein n=1 Tax=Drosophila gunungcola TaxID=103775 RepID=A0A9Q0BS58_9MUSC|nr:hypothetical protein M5D96_003935 [Drosophila gunungcola]
MRPQIAEIQDLIGVGVGVKVELGAGAEAGVGVGALRDGPLDMPGTKDSYLDQNLNRKEKAQTKSLERGGWSGGAEDPRTCRCRHQLTPDEDGQVGATFKSQAASSAAIMQRGAPEAITMSRSCSCRDGDGDGPEDGVWDGAELEI